MSHPTATFLRHRERLDEIIRVLAQYGLAERVHHGGGVLGVRVTQGLAQRSGAADIVALSTGERLARALAELGTTWIKFGQMLSLRPDVVGAEVAADLASLQASVPADPPGAAQALVEHELGAPVSDLFASFESEPMASGSVAQVHRATLTDGTPVAVKVLHNGAERRVLDDLEIMQALAAYLEHEDPALTQLRPVVMVDEFSQMMHDAIDLSQELRNLQRFIQNFAHEADIIFPGPYPQLSRRRVLTMSLLTGTAFSDRAGVELTGWHPEALVRRASNVYLEMIFRDSFFHADPHPGNFLIPDRSHLSILDAGDVGRISSLRRRQLEDLVIASGTQDIDTFVDVIIEITAPPPSVDLDRLRTQIETWLDRFVFIEIGRLDMARIIETGMQLLHNNGLVLPSDLAVLFRVMMQLQGLGLAIDTEVRATELLEPYLDTLLGQRFDPRRLVRHTLHTLRGWDHLFSTLPSDIEDIVKQIRAGKLALDHHVHDSDGAIDNLVDGLVAASALLASAQLISRRSGPMIGPFSAPGLVTAGLGVLTWQRLIRRRHTRKSWVTRARELAELRSAGSNTPSRTRTQVA